MSLSSDRSRESPIPSRASTCRAYSDLAKDVLPEGLREKSSLSHKHSRAGGREEGVWPENSSGKKGLLGNAMITNRQHYPSYPFQRPAPLILGDYVLPNFRESH